MIDPTDLNKAVISLQSNSNYKVVVDYIKEYREALNSVLINTEGDNIFVAQGAVRSLDKIIKKITKEGE